MGAKNIVQHYLRKEGRQNAFPSFFDGMLVLPHLNTGVRKDKVEQSFLSKQATRWQGLNEAEQNESARCYLLRHYVSTAEESHTIKILVCLY